MAKKKKKSLKTRIEKLIKKLKRKVYNFRDASPTGRKLANSLIYHFKKIRYNLKTASIKTDDKTAIFITFQGKSYGCSPKAIYEYMLSDEKYKDWTFIWLFKKPGDFPEVAANPNTKVYKYNRNNLHKYLPVAKYWISNYRFPQYIWPRKKQVYVQCWHGTPLKRLGHDLTTSENALNTMDEIYRLYDLDALKFDYMISPSRYASERFISAWGLDTKHMEHKMLEIGYPRNDFLSNHTAEDVREIKERLGIPLDKKVILYAPTWRDNQRGEEGFTYDLNMDFDKLRKELGDEYVLVFRLHYLVASAFSFEDYEGFIYDASSYGDINHLYVIADLLVTDYSSVFFDYGTLKKPMMFYMYDLEDYRDSIRGMYFDVNELPGPIITKEEELADTMKNALNNFVYDDKYKAFNEKFNKLEDGKAAKRLADIVFKA